MAVVVVVVVVGGVQVLVQTGRLKRDSGVETGMIDGGSSARKPFWGWAFVGLGSQNMKASSSLRISRGFFPFQVLYGWVSGRCWSSTGGRHLFRAEDDR